MNLEYRTVEQFAEVLCTWLVSGGVGQPGLKGRKPDGALGFLALHQFLAQIREGEGGGQTVGMRLLLSRRTAMSRALRVIIDLRARASSHAWRAQWLSQKR